MEGLDLEAGINGKIKFTTDMPTSEMSANAYVSLGLAGLSALVNFDANRLDEDTATSFDLFADLNYEIDFFTPGVTALFYDLSDNSSDGTHINLEPYLAFAVTKGLKIKTTLALKNVVGDNDLDWKFTLRFEWNPKVKF
jgi:hypothetical protein